jgi:hypothetical protein
MLKLQLRDCSLFLWILFQSLVLSQGIPQIAHDGVGSRVGLRAGSLAWLFARALDLLGRGLHGGGLVGPLTSLDISG